MGSRCSSALLRLCRAADAYTIAEEGDGYR